MSKGESRIGANSASQTEVHIKPPKAAQCTPMVNAPLMSCNTAAVWHYWFNHTTFCTETLFTLVINYNTKNQLQ